MRQLTVDGYLAADAEEKTSASGKPFLKLKVGNTEFLRGENKTEWFDVVTFDQNTISVFGPYLKKGRHISVTGTLDFSPHNGTDGKVYVNPAVLAYHIEFVRSGSRGNDSTEEPDINVVNNEPEIKSSAPAPQDEQNVTVQETVNVTTTEEDDDDELPF